MARAWGDPALWRLLRAADRVLHDLAAPLRRAVASAVTAAAAGGPVVPERRVGSLLARVRLAVVDLFGDGPDLARRLPLTREVSAVLGAAARLGATPALRDLARALRDRPDELAALREPAIVVPRLPLEAPVWERVGPDGLRLSDRLWRSGQETRRQLEAAVHQHVALGTPPGPLARDLERFLTVQGRALAGDGGEYGLYAIRRLVENEAYEAYRAGVIEAARLSPLAVGVRWQRAAGAEPHAPCDGLATQDAYGLGKGIFPPEAVPSRPHVGCKCWQQVISRSDAPDIPAVGVGWPLMGDGIAELVTGRTR